MLQGDMQAGGLQKRLIYQLCSYRLIGGTLEKGKGGLRLKHTGIAYTAGLNWCRSHLLVVSAF